MRRALVIGIDNYSTAPLNGCVADAQRISALLERHTDGSRNFDVVTMLGETGKPKFTKALVKAAITELFSKPAQVALLYFSGHGASTGFGGYLVTPDATAYDEGVSMADVLKAASNTKVQEVIILLDCCHAGHLGEIPLAPDSVQLREGICIIVASRANEVAVESAAGGVFTQLVCDALEGGAADPLGRVTAAAVYAYVDQSLSAWEQRPQFRANLSAFNELRKVAPTVAPSILRLLPEYFATPDTVYPLDPSYEPSVDPRNETNERTFRDFQQLRDARLLVPDGEDHLYYAAINSKACKLTARGRFYWRLANDKMV